MKFLTISLLCLIFVGCANSSTQTTSTAKSTTTTDSASVTQNHTINFVGAYDLTLQLITQDNFETATLIDNSDTTYQLKREISANGIRLANDSVVIHFKNTIHGNEGYVELVKGKPIEIKEFKPEI